MIELLMGIYIFFKSLFFNDVNTQEHYRGLRKSAHHYWYATFPYLVCGHKFLLLVNLDLIGLNGIVANSFGSILMV